MNKVNYVLLTHAFGKLGHVFVNIILRRLLVAQNKKLIEEIEL